MQLHNFYNTNSYLPILNGSILADLVILFIVYYTPYFDSFFLKKWYETYRLSAVIADVLILGYMGAMPAEGIYLLVARIATAYYFIHFLIILPLLSKRERTLDVPLSITEPVLGGMPNQAMARDDAPKLKSLG